jgi:hypothetical protein
MGLHDGHRQRAKDRYRQLGADALADHELLELALFYAIPRQDTNETAHRLLKRFRSLQGVLQATPEELEKEEGVGRSAALLLCLIGDISRRARITSLPEKILNSPDRTGAYFMELLTGQKRELLYQVCLDGKGKLLTLHRQGHRLRLAGPCAAGGGERPVRRSQHHHSGAQPPQRRGPALRRGCAGDPPHPGGAGSAGHPSGRSHHCGRR